MYEHTIIRDVLYSVSVLLFTHGVLIKFITILNINIIANFVRWYGPGFIRCKILCVKSVSFPFRLGDTIIKL